MKDGTISRRAAIDEMTLTLNSPITEEQWDVITDVDFEHTNEITFHTKHGKIVKFVKASAQPERKKGHWTEANTHTFGIYECDVCKGWTYIPNKPSEYNFCPRCGADMREGKADE